MFNDLYYQFRPPEFTVRPDLRTLRGLLSAGRRQVDVAVYQAGAGRPVLMVECKRYNRRLNVKDVESFIGMLQDLDASNGLLVGPLGFSRTAIRRASASHVALHELREHNAVRLNWRELSRKAFPWDEAFHPQMGDGFHALLTSADVEGCIAALEEIPFEEWSAAMDALLRHSPVLTEELLLAIARSHADDGWRFNAVRLLGEHAFLDASVAHNLLGEEEDPETRELLESYTACNVGV